MKGSYEDKNLPSDFGENLNRNILLTGAGFSKDMGGYLANDIANLLWNMDAPVSVKQMIYCNDYNYEIAFDEASGEDKDFFERGISKIFAEIDGNMKGTISRNNYWYIMKKFLCESKYNFIVTSNQDLLLERIILSQAVSDVNNKVDQDEEAINQLCKLNYPYSNFLLSRVVKSKKNNSYAIQYEKEYHFNDFSQAISYENRNILKRGYLNYIKLHGSANWRDANDNSLLISGMNKEGKINENTVLKASFELFEELCKKNDLRILIIGYSFNDEHINVNLTRAINEGARLSIIDCSSQKHFMENSKFSNRMKESVSKYYHDNFVDLKHKDFQDLENWFDK